MKQIDLNFYPNWTRKAITFTIDDGNVKLDKKFMDIVKPAGIKGTFNLCTPLRTSIAREDFPAFYNGYEIANHCYRHPMAFTEKTKREIKNELFDAETADPNFAYLTEEENLYRVAYFIPNNPKARWSHVATDEKYLACVEECQKELEEVFGKGSVRSFVWPYGEQKNERVIEMLKACGFQSIRKTGCVKGTTGYALPADRSEWSYNANYPCMEETAAEFAAYPDDGELKFYCFGVHSHDFENADRWDVLIDFCEKYGNRPEDFWYASVGEIFDYEDAVKAVEITDTEIINHSNIHLCIKIDGVRKTLYANSSIAL